jgi:hypothetical protein
MLSSEAVSGNGYTEKKMGGGFMFRLSEESEGMQTLFNPIQHYRGYVPVNVTDPVLTVPANVVCAHHLSDR